MEESNIIIYQTEDGLTKIQTRLENETVWLTQAQMAELFGKGRTTITEHIQNIFKEGELEAELVCREFRHTTQHVAIAGKTQDVITKYYNLDVIISVGYRVKSLQGTKFRQWATARLREIDRLDDFVKMTSNAILQNAGTISHQQALQKAKAEYELYKEKTKNELSEVEKHFVKKIDATGKELDTKKINK